MVADVSISFLFYFCFISLKAIVLVAVKLFHLPIEFTPLITGTSISRNIDTLPEIHEDPAVFFCFMFADFLTFSVQSVLIFRVCMSLINST